MLSFPDPQWQSNGNPKKHSGNSSLGVRMLHLPADQSSVQGRGLLGMLGSDQ